MGGGGGKFLLEMGEKPGIGGFFYNGGDGEFSKSLYIVGRGLLTPPLFYEDPPILPTHHSNFVQSPFHFPVIPNPHPTVLSVVLFLWLNGWSHHIWYAILLNDDIDLHMLGLVTLLLEGPWCVFYAIRHQVYWGLKHKVVCCWYSDLISHAQTQKHRQHTQRTVNWHTHINIYLHHLLCAQSSKLCHIKWLNE